MKNITIAGGLGRDATLRRTQGGDAVLSFGVGVEERNGQDKRTLWFDCSLWGKRGEALERYLTKGTKVAVSGDLSTREHEGKTYLTIRADQVTLQGGGQREEKRVDHNAIGSQRDNGGPVANDDFDSTPF